MNIYIKMVNNYIEKINLLIIFIDVISFCIFILYSTNKNIILIFFCFMQLIILFFCFIQLIFLFKKIGHIEYGTTTLIAAIVNNIKLWIQYIFFKLQNFKLLKFLFMKKKKIIVKNYKDYKNKNKYYNCKYKIKIFKRNYYKSSTLLGNGDNIKSIVNAVRNKGSSSNFNQKVNTFRKDNYYGSSGFGDDGDGKKPPHGNNNSIKGHYEDKIKYTNSLKDLFLQFKHRCFNYYDIPFKRFKDMFNTELLKKGKIEILKDFDDNILNLQDILYRDLLLIKSSNKIKNLNLADNEQVLSEFQNLLLNMYEFPDEEIFNLFFSYYINELINNYNHGRFLVMHPNECFGFEVVATTPNFERGMVLYNNSITQVEIVQQQFYNRETGEVGVFYVPKIIYKIKVLNKFNEEVEKDCAFTINRIDLPTEERTLLEFFLMNSYIQLYTLFPENWILLLEKVLVKETKNIKLRAEEYLILFLKTQPNLFQNNQITFESFLDFVNNLNILNMQFNLRINLNWGSRGILDNNTYNTRVNEIIQDQEQVIAHIGYYVDLCYRRPNLIDKIFYRHSGIDITNVDIDVRMDMFDAINLNEGLYLIIQTYGIENLRENYTVQEIYELIKEEFNLLNINNEDNESNFYPKDDDII